MNLKLIACEIFEHEINFAISNAVHKIAVEFVPKALHDVPTVEMTQQLQERIAVADQSQEYDYILLAYGLCNNGTAGLHTQHLPLVIPRVHDCIGVLMGSSKTYCNYFNLHPGCYYLSPGWVEHSEVADSGSIQSQLNMSQSYDYFLQHYGEDNAAFLYEQLGAATKHYNELTYIRTGVEVDSSYEDEARQEAARNDWEFNIFNGTTALLQRFVNGEWSCDEFAVIPPGESIQASYNETIFKN
jgi:hypothetical protein